VLFICFIDNHPSCLQISTSSSAAILFLSTHVPSPCLLAFVPCASKSTDTLERKLSSNEKPLIIFQQLQKEGRNPLFMLRYAGKGREGDHERERERRERQQQQQQQQQQQKEILQKDEDPTTPKGVPEGYSARYNEVKAGNGMF